MHRGGGVAVAARILRVSTTFRRTVERLGVLAGSPAYRAVSATIRSLASGELPGPGDVETPFAPGRAFVRRVVGQNLWILYRFDEDQLYVETIVGIRDLAISAGADSERSRPVVSWVRDGPSDRAGRDRDPALRLGRLHQCGGTGCGSLQGGGAECCIGTINNNNPPPCDGRLLNAPCKLNCISEVCCATTCINGSGNLVCGGTGCSGLPGGSANCCGGAILQSNVYCNGDPSRAPCILP
jgi:hypothetical protein